MILYNLIVALVALPSHIHINAFSVSDVYLSSLTTSSINDYNLAIDKPIHNNGDISVSDVYLSSLTTSSINDYNLAIDKPIHNNGDIISPMTWGGNRISENMYRVLLPPTLCDELRSYANRMGITDFYRGLVIDGKPYYPGEEKLVTFKDHNWMVHRPKGHWNSNMHWLSPANESSHDNYLSILSAGGFDKVLDSIGTYFNLAGLSAYHLSFIGVSQCEKGFIHTDVNGSGKAAFNMIIPLMLVEGGGAELEILSDDETTTRYYDYEYNVASMIGDNALHATASCDYQARGLMRMCATVYVGDITTSNVRNLLMSLTQAYPPVGDAKHLLDRAGDHWSKVDSSKRLPSVEVGRLISGYESTY